MMGFLGAHGFDPGPTQRPLTAGVISGALATVPASAILHGFGSLRVEAQIIHASVFMTIAAGWTVLALAGAIYSRLFGRAANARKTGWLLGMIFGFALWAAGAVMVIPLVSGGYVPAGQAAIGIFLSIVVWGFVLGLIHPLVHRPLHERIDAGARRMGPQIGTRTMRVRGK